MNQGEGDDEIKGDDEIVKVSRRETIRSIECTTEREIVGSAA